MPRSRPSGRTTVPYPRPFRRSARAIRRELSAGEFFLKGSLVERYLPCGTEGCACHKDRQARHGPYYQWTRKVRGKTVAVWVPREVAEVCRRWMKEGERLGTQTERLEELSVEALRWLAREARQRPKKRG